MSDFDLDYYGPSSSEMAMREIESAVSNYRWRYQEEATDDPCDCELSASIPEEPYMGPHTVREHRKGSCGGAGMPEPCGGCTDCILAQLLYYRSKERLTE